MIIIDKWDSTISNGFYSNALHWNENNKTSDDNADDIYIKFHNDNDDETIADRTKEDNDVYKK